MSKLLIAFAASLFVAAFWAVLLWYIDPSMPIVPLAVWGGFVTFIVIAVFMGGDTRDEEKF